MAGGVEAVTPAGLEIVLGHGLAVFPCGGNKRPLTEHGVKDASADRAVINDWAARHPGCNWGAAMTDRIMAVDIDMKHGVDGAGNLRELIVVNSSLPNTLTNLTPNRGQHRLFTTPRAVKNSVGEVCAGVDIRSAGGYILIPPSRLSTGDYAWRDALAEIADAPEWLFDLAANAKGKKSAAPKKVAEGTRNNTLFQFAAGLRARGMDEVDARNALRARNAECEPPLDERELEKILASAWRYPAGFPLTDLGNAERLVAAHGADWKFIPELGWCEFRNGLWVPDRGRGIVQVAGKVARGMLAESATMAEDNARRALATWAVKSESKRSLDATVGLAATQPEVVDFIDRFDSDDWLLACRNGVVNLRDQSFRAGQREDRLMSAAAVEYDAEALCPRWDQFLRETFGEDDAMLRFIARTVGYSLTGSIVEQVLFIAHGDGANGKSTFINTLRRILGDFAATVSPDSLTNRKAGAIPNDAAGLRGKRFAAANETEQDSRLAEGFIKAFTGDDAIRVRFLYREWFDMVPKVKLWLLTNHKPKIAGSDYAIWRRIVLIPFEQTVGKDRRDKHLQSKLMLEAPGILNWALRGCADWQAQGLAQPRRVVDATQQYRQDEDRITAFVKECLGDDEASHARKTAVRGAYEAWCRDQDEPPVGKKVFHGKLVDEKGFREGKRDGYDVYLGVRVVL